MTAPVGPPPIVPAPNCESCAGNGQIYPRPGIKGLHYILCEECLGIGVSPAHWHHHILWLATRLQLREGIPEMVVLCGSTRFKDAFYSEGKRLSFEGKIVLSVSDLDPAPENRRRNVPIDETLKAQLDELHRRKIDLADTVYVLNVDGYIGESTRGEIEYAHSIGKPVTYLEPVEG